MPPAAAPPPPTHAQATPAPNDYIEDANRPPPVLKRERRARWDSELQFVLTCVGFAVGLGNIWMFPKAVYEHGGGAFLIQYLFCAVFFGLPVLYLEMAVGQYCAAGPSLVFKKYMPAMQGLGWSMATAALFMSLYYNVIIAWVLLYIVDIFLGRSSKWTMCDNSWNTEFCTSTLMDEDRCSHHEYHKRFWNGSCYTSSHYTTTIMTMHKESSVSPAEEYFERRLLGRTGLDMMSFSEFNWPVAVALLLLWTATALVLIKSIQTMGRLSYYITIIPSVIVLIMFFRGVSLDGASKGVEFYLKTDFNKMHESKSWKWALSTLCFSLSTGSGGFLSMASYNRKRHNAFRDAFIVLAADTGVSVIGGFAVFSVLGFLAQQRGVSVPEVVKGSTGLAFIVYPEAIARMPAPWLWAFLFFLMMFLLGLSSLVGMVEVMFTCIADSYPQTNKYKWAVCLGTALTMTLLGLTMCFESGLFWFTFFSEYSSLALCFNTLLEVILVLWIGGIKNHIIDLRAMFGKPKHLFSRVFGPSGYWLYCNSLVTAPIITIGVIVFSFLDRQLVDVGYGSRKAMLPDWTLSVCWIIEFFPLLMIPAFFIINYLDHRKHRKPLRDLFRMQENHPSFYYRTSELSAGVPSDTETAELSRKPSDVLVEMPSNVPPSPTRPVPPASAKSAPKPKK